MNPVALHPINASVLVVEPDPVLAEQISADLQTAGYQPIIAPDAKTGWHQANLHQPNLIIIARMLGAESGLELCSQLRQKGNYVPVLMLLVRDTLAERIACLEAGADDYFLMPQKVFNCREDLLRLIHLYLKPATDGTERLHFADLTLDLPTRTVLRHNQQMIALTMKEFELLKYFMEHPREVLSRDQILANVWGYDFMGESNVIEVYIRYLRLKLESNGHQRLIHTVRGLGYVLRES